MTALVSALSGEVLPPMVPQQLPVMSQLTEETAMEPGTDQGNGKTTDGAEAQQSGSQGLTEDANAT